jgi:hypothetical protein
MTSPVIHRDMLYISVSLRGTTYRVMGFLEDGAFIAESFDPPIDYNSLTFREWAEVDYQYWLQTEPPERKDDGC